MSEYQDSASVGFDVHTDSIAVAIARPGRAQPEWPRTIPNRHSALLRLITRRSPDGLVPRGATDRVTTDRRAATLRAREHRSPAFPTRAGEARARTLTESGCRPPGRRPRVSGTRHSHWPVTRALRERPLRDERDVGRDPTRDSQRDPPSQSLPVSRSGQGVVRRCVMP